MRHWVSHSRQAMPFNSDLCRKTFETLQIERISHFYSILFLTSDVTVEKTITFYDGD